ncbi:MAG: pro-sigmaK processing inhibitor BofA family protein [Bacilli bacterium]|nr:pro-sigmaK processing inhibitor BofA family protein [Bacilli bacterium]
MKYIKWFLKSLVFGIVFLFVFNLVGRFINLNIPINFLTIMIVGTLRIPGAVILLVLSYI